MSVAGASCRKPLGQWLVEEQLLAQEALEHALHEQRRLGGRLGERLVESGKVSRRDVARALARQNGMPFISLVERPPQMEALLKLDATDARRLGVLPVSVCEGEGAAMLLVVMKDPEQRHLLDEIAERTGCSVEAALCEASELQDGLVWYETLGQPWSAGSLRPATDEDVPAPKFLTGELDLGDPRIQALVDEDLRSADIAAALESLPELAEEPFVPVRTPSDDDAVLDAEEAGATEEPVVMELVEDLRLQLIELSLEVEALKVALAEAQDQARDVAELRRRVTELEAAGARAPIVTGPPPMPARRAETLPAFAPPPPADDADLPLAPAMMPTVKLEGRPDVNADEDLFLAAGVRFSELPETRLVVEDKDLALAGPPPLPAPTPAPVDPERTADVPVGELVEEIVEELAAAGIDEIFEEAARVDATTPADGVDIAPLPPVPPPPPRMEFAAPPRRAPFAHLFAEAEASGLRSVPPMRERS